MTLISNGNITEIIGNGKELSILTSQGNNSIMAITFKKYLIDKINFEVDTPLIPIGLPGNGIKRSPTGETIVTLDLAIRSIGEVMIGDDKEIIKNIRKDINSSYKKVSQQIQTIDTSKLKHSLDF